MQGFRMGNHIDTTPTCFQYGRYVTRCVACGWACEDRVMSECQLLFVDHVDDAQLHLLDVTNTTQYNIARSSINLWLATPEKDSMFYRPAASAMNVLLGQQAAAFDNISVLLNNRIEGSTWYREGAQGSCTETPYAAAWAVVNWLVQSWNTTDAGSVPQQVRRRQRTTRDFFLFFFCKLPQFCSQCCYCLVVLCASVHIRRQ